MCSICLYFYVLFKKFDFWRIFYPLKNEKKEIFLKFCQNNTGHFPPLGAKNSASSTQINTIKKEYQG
jgi:hypothetical protein